MREVEARRGDVRGANTAQWEGASIRPNAWAIRWVGDKTLTCLMLIGHLLQQRHQRREARTRRCSPARRIGYRVNRQMETARRRTTRDQRVMLHRPKQTLTIRIQARWHCRGERDAERCPKGERARIDVGSLLGILEAIRPTRRLPYAPARDCGIRLKLVDRHHVAEAVFDLREEGITRRITVTACDQARAQIVA